MDRTTFEGLVAKALDAIPTDIRRRMDNVEVVVEDWPDAETMRQAGVNHAAQLLGFYHGVPLTARSHSYYMVLPDKISIYRMPVLLRCHSPDEVLTIVHRVLRHEIGHHFGIHDERLLEIGAY
jgi:predicted Zn-dependent protease with MMP-like domain